MYINKIRDIFDVKISSGLDRTGAFKMAEKCGFNLLTFNGDIYVNVSPGKWEHSGFRIQDLEIKYD